VDKGRWMNAKALEQLLTQAVQGLRMRVTLIHFDPNSFDALFTDRFSLMLGVSAPVGGGWSANGMSFHDLGSCVV
jgi:hypothetical protein